MMLHEISLNVAEGIPYRNFFEKINIIRHELRKNRHVEIIDELKIIYSSKKWKDKDVRR